MRLRRFWNGRLLGLPKAGQVAFGSLVLFLLDRISTFFWKYNLNCFGQGAVVQSFVTIRFPGNISISREVNIARHVTITSEFPDSYLKIGKSSLIDKYAALDFSGGLALGENVVISEEASIYTHSHGLDPRSIPVKKPLDIQDDVWIGTRVIVLESVTVIGKGSVVAAGSVVTKNVPPKTLVGGVPARVIRNIDE